jgi:hypothetical protein
MAPERHVARYHGCLLVPRDLCQKLFPHGTVLISEDRKVEQHYRMKLVHPAVVHLCRMQELY